jgi:hypothetical protein
MRPRLFIASSAEGLNQAKAIFANLERVAEPTLWSEGFFELGDVTIQRLIGEVRKSDFGVFVCSADDLTDKRGSERRAPRDNVIYELGLFTGYLGEKRAYVLTPRNIQLHLPSDLGGVTFGTFDISRSDADWRQATTSACTEIAALIAEHSYARRPIEDELDALAVAYACCEWIPNVNPYASIPRWQRKAELFDRMTSISERIGINKQSGFKPGNVTNDPKLDDLAKKTRLTAVIKGNPQSTDLNAIISIDLASVPDGHARIEMIYTAQRVVEVSTKMSPAVSKRIDRWLKVDSEEHYVRDACTLLRESVQANQSQA